jgi:hypothetical protein
VISGFADIGGTPAEHPPNSPDLVPCDLLLLSVLKCQLHGKKFGSDIDMKSLLILYMFGCAEPCKKCMASDGCYLEEETMTKSQDARDTERCKQSHYF